MSSGTFNGFNSPYTFDHGAAELQRAHEERRKREERQERCEGWLVRHFQGHTFTDLRELEFAACELARTFRGSLDSELEQIIRQSCRALMAGLVSPERFAGKVRVIRGQSIEFLAA